MEKFPLPPTQGKGCVNSKQGAFLSYQVWARFYKFIQILTIISGFSVNSGGPLVFSSLGGAFGLTFVTSVEICYVSCTLV